MDIFTTHLRHIENVSLEDDDWGGIFDDSVADLTRFTKLKRFIYLTSIFCDDDEDYNDDDDDNPGNDFVLLKFTNGKEQYYYLNDEKNKNSQVEYSKILLLRALLSFVMHLYPLIYKKIAGILEHL